MSDDLERMGFAATACGLTLQLAGSGTARTPP